MSTSMRPRAWVIALIVPLAVAFSSLETEPLDTSLSSAPLPASACAVTCGPQTHLKDGQCLPATDSHGLLTNSFLQEPPTYQSEDGVLHIDLTLDISPYADTHYDCPGGLRMFNGIVPGPTMSVFPGDELHIHYLNNLDPEEPGQLNTIRDANITNLHVHGLHLSAKEPVDNVKIEINGKERYTYIYKIPVDHMPGHHWYHPHHHGSTSMQTLSAHGSIIVKKRPNNPNNKDDEAPGFATLPPPLNQMREVMAISGSPAMGREFYGESINNMLHTAGDTQFECRNLTENAAYRMVNFQTNPKFAQEMGEPVLFHWLDTDWTLAMNFTIRNANGSPDCSMHLMAKDGIPLYDAPRRIRYAYLDPGNRASIIFTCDGAGVAEVVDMVLGGDETLGTHEPTVVMTLVVSNIKRWFETDAPATSTAAVINHMDPLAVVWPYYLADLRQEVPTTFNSIKYEVICAGEKPLNLELFPWKDNDFCFYMVNRELFNPDKALFRVEYDEVVETTLINSFVSTQVHPHHQHINPFQVTELQQGVEDIYGDYIKVGDWYDTLSVTDPVMATKHSQDEVGGYTAFKVRWRPTDFPDELMIFHCHILQHEDMGMMSSFHISHVDGDYSPVDTLGEPVGDGQDKESANDFDAF